MVSYIKLKHKHYLSIIFMFSYHYLHYIIITTIIITIIIPLLFHYHSTPLSIFFSSFWLALLKSKGL